MVISVLSSAFLKPCIILIVRNDKYLVFPQHSNRHWDFIALSSHETRRSSCPNNTHIFGGYVDVFPLSLYVFLCFYITALMLLASLRLTLAKKYFLKRQYKISESQIFDKTPSSSKKSYLNTW